MKNIFTNSELAHTYANQSQQSGRNSSGSFYFDGKAIYSYGRHFPIANIVTNDNGNECMLFTYRTYFCDHMPNLAFGIEPNNT